MAIKKSENQIMVITRVKMLRVERNKSQQQLATVLDATNGTIGNIESLKYANKYTLKQLNAIAKYFEVPIESFFMNEGEDTLSIAEYTDRVCEYLEG